MKPDTNSLLLLHQERSNEFKMLLLDYGWIASLTLILGFFLLPYIKDESINILVRFFWSLLLLEHTVIITLNHFDKTSFLFNLIYTTGNTAAVCLLKLILLQILIIFIIFAIHVVIAYILVNVKKKKFKK